MEAPELLMRIAFLILCWCAAWPVLRSPAQSLPATASQGESQESPLLDDATLHDVMFVDREFGWAVGEHGAIWHTIDGGKQWYRQHSPVEMGLGGVWFANRELGWAVGGKTMPYLGTSQGVVLRTIDGGQTWKQELAFLPALARVKFFDKDNGLAWGRGSGGEPLGVFATDDSGRNWRAAAVAPLGAWWNGDFINERTGIVVGSAGQVSRIASGEATPLSIETGGREIRDVNLSLDATGWAVGDDGLILQTRDGGKSWQAVDILPPEVNEVVDWRCVAMRDKQIWIAGSPGSVMLSSIDSGETWQGHATGSNTPISRIMFVDDSHGWAVGQFGTILHTADGGQTWQVQRAAGELVAVLMLLTDESQIPMETLAKFSSDGYRTAVHLLRTKQEANDPSYGARLAEALSTVGCNSITETSLKNPSPPYSNIVASPEYRGGGFRIGSKFTSLSKEEQNAKLMTEVVAQLRLWRPSVVIAPSGEQTESIDDLLAEVAADALTQAADEQQFKFMQDQLALKPWQVSRLFALLPAGERGTHRVQSADAATLTTKTFAEIGTSAWSLIRSEFEPPPESNEFLLKVSMDGELTGAVDDLAAGLSLAPGCDCRRPAATATDFDGQGQRRLAEKRRNLKNIFRFAEGNPALLGQVGQMLAELDAASAASLLFELATYFRQAGEMDLASATLELLARRYPDDPQVDAALVWLVQYYASGEAAHAYRPIVSPVSQAAAVEEQGVQKVEPASATDENLEPVGAVSPRFTRAVEVAQHIAQTRPLLYSEPMVRVPWAMAERKRGVPDAANQYLESLSIRAPGEAWQQCGIAERWIADTTKPAPAKRRVICRFTGTKPKLDGNLDEEMWQAPGLTIDTPQGETSTVVFANDENYLYVGIKCAKDAKLSYATEGRARTYDADLSGQDRVRLLLDVDRDYTTYFDLAVDHRGWTNDACWQDQSWNPKWFVAAGDNAEHWTSEAAIPWSELTANPPKIGAAWVFSAERLGHAASSKVVGPNDFCLLLFK
jgi:photosystem II stability/assembly factor-like uncharacterized protein